MRLWRRRRRHTRPISEASAYARCHGDRDTELVRLVSREPRRPRYELPVSGETLRQAFELRLEQRAKPPAYRDSNPASARSRRSDAAVSACRARES